MGQQTRADVSWQSIAGGGSSPSGTAEAADPRAQGTGHDFDVDSFLRDSTQTLWEQKQVGRIPELYASHARIHLGSDEMLHGSQALVERAVAWLAALPDLRVFIDDMLRVRRAEAFLASVRWTAVGHNAGPSTYGPPTGRRVVLSGITNSRIEEGRYVEQWIELGDADLVRQFGLDARFAPRPVPPNETSPDFELLLGRTTAVRSSPSVRLGGAPESVGALIEAALESIWNNRDLAQVHRFFAAHYREYGPGRRVVFGRDEVQQVIVSLMGACPDLRMYFDDVFYDGDLSSCRSSTRWTLLGTNTGPSVYGPPTNASLRLSGITNHRLEGGQFVEGWMAYSEACLARELTSGAPPGRAGETSEETTP